MAHDADSVTPPASARASSPVIIMPAALIRALRERPAPPPFTQPAPLVADFPAELQPGTSVASAVLGLFGLKKQADELLAPARLAARHRYEAALAQHQHGDEEESEGDRDLASCLAPALMDTGRGSQRKRRRLGQRKKSPGQPKWREREMKTSSARG